MKQLAWILACAITVAAAAGPVRAAWPTDPNVNVAVAAAANLQSPFGVISDALGGAYFVWFDQRSWSGTNGAFYGQRLDENGNTVWAQNGIPLTAAFNTLSGAWGASDDWRGGLIVAWFIAGDGLHAQKIDRSGNRQWGTDGIIVTTDPTADLFGVCNDAQGGAIFSWPAASGVGVVAQRIGSSGGMPWTAVPKSVASDAIAGPCYPIPDGTGGAIVAWTDTRSGQADVYAGRVDASGATVWGPSGVPVADASEAEQLPNSIQGKGGRQFIASDGLGGALLAFIRPGHQSVPTQAYAQRLDMTGSRLWGSSGRPLSSVFAIQDHPVILSYDNQGAAVVAWEDTRSGFTQVFAQLIDPAGIDSWTANGVAASTAVSELPFILGPGIGGAVVGFTAYAAGVSDVYAQRLDAGGGRVWGNTGAAISTAPGEQWGGLAVLGTCAAIVGWKDSRSDPADVYAQGIDIDGHLGCPFAAVDTGAPLRDGISLATSPNPASPATFISYNLAADTYTRLSVRDASGRLVRTLVNALQPAGRYAVRWDGSDDRNGKVPSGVYWAVLEGGTHRRTQRVILIR